MMADAFQDRLHRCVDAFVDSAAGEIIAADRIVICHEGGFGHQFHGPDLVRRLHAPERCLFIFMAWFGRNNPCTPLIWSGIRILHMPTLPPALQPECVERAKDMVAWATTLGRLIHERIHRRFGKPAINYEGFLHYAACARPHLYYKENDGGGRSPNWVLTYYDLVATVPMPKRRLPTVLRERIGAHMARCFGGTDSIATLYLRQKGGGTDSSARSGSHPVEYLPTVQILNQKGYRVFIMGDLRFACEGAVHADHVVASLQEHGLFDAIFADLADLDPINFANDWRFYDSSRDLLLRRLIDLYLMTECRIFIGEAGGGSQLSPYDGIPTVNLNVLPYATALPNTAHLYKVVEDRQGRLLPFQALLSRHRWAFEFPEAQARTNNAYEIADTVATFLNTLPQHPFGIGRDRLVGGAEDLWMLHCNGVISPAFFRIYERGATAV